MAKPELISKANNLNKPVKINTIRLQLSLLSPYLYRFTRFALWQRPAHFERDKALLWYAATYFRL